MIRDRIESRLQLEPVWKAGIPFLPQYKARDAEPGETKLKIEPGAPTREGAALSLEWIDMGISLALEGKIDALVTGPVCKEGIAAAGIPFSGHTERLAEKAGVSDVGMMMKGENLTVVLLTTHLPLSEAIARVTPELILAKTKLINAFYQRYFDIRPKIALAALNPHAGEAGLFGEEEKTILTPATEIACAEGFDMEGPVPADTVFFQALRGKYDVVLCLYHDQGMIPVKTVAFDSTVNVTIGLPFIRTSVDHGPAFDIAGKGIADAGSMIAAIRLALKLAHRRT